MDLDLSFERVQQELGALRQVSFDEASSLLERVRINTTSAALLAEYAPQKLTGFSVMHLLDMHRYGLSPLDKAAYDVILNLFPCNADYMFENMLNDDDMPGIVIDPVFNMSNEEFSELVASPADFGSGDMTSLLTFVRYLSFVIDAPYFDLACEHFGWSVETPESCASTHGIDTVDMDRFYELLDEHNLADFALPFKCEQQATGNIFLDWTLDEVYNEFIPYTLKSIHQLVADWSSAKPQVDQLNAAAERFKREHWIAAKIIELWDQCVRYKDGRMPRTLLELWGGHPVVDEFYGEIGVEEDDD
jgi:hypothetical protein